MLAGRGEPHGTVIAADFQKAGRGRIKGRFWDMEKGSSLAFTILLRFPGVENIPRALTLRAGLALSLAVEDFAPVLAGRVLIKWPNDILITGSARKLAGILAEADGGIVHIGMGLNVAQKQFPDFLRNKATSISLAIGAASGGEITTEERFTLLEKILVRLYNEIEAAGGEATDWKSRVESRLYKKGEQISFAEGAADSGKMVNGVLTGIDSGGELLIMPSGGGEPRSFTAGELVF